MTETMKTPFLIDAHLDLAWNALQWNRDLTQSVQTLRVREGSTPGKGRAMNTVALLSFSSSSNWLTMRGHMKVPARM